MDKRSSTPPPGLWASDPQARRLDQIEQELLELRVLVERIADRLGLRAA
jgi:hypothetical protein